MTEMRHLPSITTPGSANSNATLPRDYMCVYSKPRSQPEKKPGVGVSFLRVSESSQVKSKTCVQCIVKIEDGN